MTLLDFIDDGYTEDGYLEGVEGIHNAVRFKYRPMQYKERETVADAIARKPVGEYVRVICHMICEKVEEWDIAQSNGSSLPKTVDWTAKLKPEVVNGIYGIISGRRASDPDPQNPDVDAEHISDAIASGGTVGQQRGEADAKN